MRILLAAVLCAAACGGAPQRPTGAAETRPAETRPRAGAIVLHLGQPTPLPGTGLQVMLHHIDPYEPRHEFPMTRSFVERRLARAWLVFRRGDDEQVKRWEAGEHEVFGVRFRLTIETGQATLTRLE